MATATKSVISLAKSIIACDSFEQIKLSFGQDYLSIRCSSFEMKNSIPIVQNFVNDYETWDRELSALKTSLDPDMLELAMRITLTKDKIVAAEETVDTYKPYFQEAADVLMSWKMHRQAGWGVIYSIE